MGEASREGGPTRGALPEVRGESAPNAPAPASPPTQERRGRGSQPLPAGSLTVLLGCRPPVDTTCL